MKAGAPQWYACVSGAPHRKTPTLRSKHERVRIATTRTRLLSHRFDHAVRVGALAAAGPVLSQRRAAA